MYEGKDEDRSIEYQFQTLVDQNLELALLLLECGAQIKLSKEWLSHVHRAADLDGMRRLLQACIGVDISDEGMLELIRKEQQLVRVLLESGWRELHLPRQQPNGEDITLMAAVLDKNVELAALLLNFGASPGGPQNDGFISLCAALFCHASADMMVELLLSHGADPSETCSDVAVAELRQGYTGEKSDFSRFSESVPDFILTSHSNEVAGYRAKDLGPPHIAVQFRCCHGPIVRLMQHGANINACFSFCVPEERTAQAHGLGSGIALGFTDISVLHSATNHYSSNK